MVTGHFATALIPYELTRQQAGGRQVPFWVFLLASQFLDFLMLALVAAGIEHLTPPDLLDLTFAGMRADMFASHDLLPVAGWSVLFGLLAWAVTRHRAAALWCMALVGFHEVCDLVVGFKHGVMAEAHPALGLNLYTQAPVAGLLIEAALAALAVWGFVRLRARAGQSVSRVTQWGLYGVLAGGALVSLPVAHTSVRTLLG